MPLDPVMKIFLDQLTAAGLPPDFAAMGAEAAKASSAATVNMLGQGPEMGRIEDHEIAGPAGPIPVRLYVPDENIVGLIVFYHGGGWVLGSIEGYDAVCRRLAAVSHCAIISVGYRLAPEHSFPAPVEDCYAALIWAEQRMTAILGRRVPLVVAGDSAGGNLAAVIAMVARERAGPKIDLQLLIFPVTDADFSTASYRDFAEGYMLPAKMMIWFWEQYVPDVSKRTNPHASPLRAGTLAGLPAALVETAGYDPLRDEGEAYAAKLQADGVRVKLRRWDSLCHGFFQMAMVLPPAGDAVDQIGFDLRTALAEAVL